MATQKAVKSESNSQPTQPIDRQQVDLQFAHRGRQSLSSQTGEQGSKTYPE